MAQATLCNKLYLSGFSWLILRGMNAFSPLIFDRSTVRRHWARARKGIAAHDALLRDTGEQLKERLSEVKRDFARSLDLSPFRFLEGPNVVGICDVAFDEEFLPFASESFDLIASNLALHWVNDVPGALAQIRGALKPGGMFIAALFGEHTLHELRECLFDAELAVSGGISPRLSPTIDLLSASALMQRAGFSLPVADKDSVTLIYSDAFALMRDLRGMGQTNAHQERLRRPTRRLVFMEAARLYQERFADAEGHIAATFDVIHLHGWK
jgi:NADH dehydrogenase [ubiquinone] 1 alpha subcomplex assembly factor 5